MPVEPTQSALLPNKEQIEDLLRQQARERDLEPSTVFEIFEVALARILHRLNNRSGEFRVKVNPNTFEMSAERLWEVIDDEEPISDVAVQKTLDAARELDPDAQIGGQFSETVDPPDLNRHSNAVTFKQQFNIKIRDAERRQQLKELLARNERLLSGTVRRVEHSSGDIIIEAHRVECRLRRSDSIPKEILRQGDRVRALIKDIVDEPNRGVQVYLTRSADEFLRKLFEREVPEIEKGVLEIVNVARQPGYRSKIAVRSLDPKVDPVGTCVGIRGSRVQSVTAELAGERVDIVQFEEVETDFVLRSLAPAEVVRVRLTGEKACDVIVDQDNLAQAIGKDGMNVRLASKLTGWHINITDSESSDQMESERMKAKNAYFMEKLDIDASVAEILYTEGFNSVEDIADTDCEDLAAIEDFDEEIAAAVHERACEAVARAEEEYKCKLAKVGKDFSSLIKDVLGSRREDLDEIMRALINSDILAVSAVADLSIDEVLEICGTISEEDASELIVAARRGEVQPASEQPEC